MGPNLNLYFDKSFSFHGPPQTCETVKMMKMLEVFVTFTVQLGNEASSSVLCLVGKQLYLHIDYYFARRIFLFFLKQPSQGDGGIRVRETETQQQRFIMYLISMSVYNQGCQIKTDCPVFVLMRTVTLWLFCCKIFFHCLLLFANFTAHHNIACDKIGGRAHQRGFSVCTRWCSAVVVSKLSAGGLGTPQRSYHLFSCVLCMLASLQYNFFNIYIQIQTVTRIHLRQ